MPDGVRHLVGVDVGGTFTDVLLASLDGSPPTLAKVLSTVDPAEGVAAGVREAARRAAVDPASVELILNGTTVVTNTVVERRGARVGLLTTRGYRYVLEIARSWTPGPVSGWMVWEKPAPLAHTRDVRELRGRIAADGTELAPHDEDDVRAAVRELRDAGVEAITVAIVHGYARPDVEALIGEWAADEAPGLPISLASGVLSEMREYERTLVAVANAYVQPAMRRYVESLEAELRRSFPSTSLNIVRSDGGVMSGEDAVERPIETVFSGPAGGVRAAVHIGALIGRPDVLSFDMGGTSTDVALSRDGQAALARRSSLTEYYKVRVPSLDVDRDRRGRWLARPCAAHGRAARRAGERRLQPRAGGLRPRRHGADRDRRERRARLPAEPARRTDGDPPRPRARSREQGRRAARHLVRTSRAIDHRRGQRPHAQRTATRVGAARARPAPVRAVRVRRRRPAARQRADGSARKPGRGRPGRPRRVLDLRLPRGRRSARVFAQLCAPAVAGRPPRAARRSWPS